MVHSVPLLGLSKRCLLLAWLHWQSAGTVALGHRGVVL